jgi:hypothetical protein
VAVGGDSTLVGLEFEPTAGRRLPEVHGVLWLDRASAELRRVEYRYVNGPPGSESPEVGGSVEFERLGGGPWIVRRWSIRMPIGEVVTRTQMVDGTLTVTRSLEVMGIHEEGGEVTAGRLASESGPVARAGAAVVEGIVWDSVARAPLAGARVFLSGTGVETLTAADGSYRLEAPAAGTYAISFGHPALGALARVVSPRAVTAVTNATTRADLAVPAPERVAAALCPAAAPGPFHGVVTGRVTGVGADTVAVRATWVRSARATLAVSYSSNWTEGRPDAAGVYVLCGVPEDQLVEVALRPVRQPTAAVRERSGQTLRAPGLELSRVEVTLTRGVPLRLDVQPRARP